MHHASRELRACFAAYPGGEAAGSSFLQGRKLEPYPNNIQKGEVMDHEYVFDAWEDLEDAPGESFYEKIEQYKVTENRASHCFFTGHRSVPDLNKNNLVAAMRSTVSFLYSKGVTSFHAGGALGFDTLAAAEIVDLRRTHPGMRLVLNLPFPNQADHWNENSKRIYYFFLQKADEVHYASLRNATDRDTARRFLLMRNRAMADASLYCITYFTGTRGGTSYTVSYAEKTGCEIINLYKPSL